MDNDKILDNETPIHFDANEVEEITTLSKRGYQLLKENLVDGAEEYFKTILDKYPKNNYALVGLGDVERKRKKFRKALSYYTTCLNLYPNNNYAHFGAADCHKALNDLESAIISWYHYLQNDPKNLTVLSRVADAYRRLKNFPKAKQTYLQVLDIDSQNSYALIGLGYLHFDFHEYETALKYWETMYQIDPKGWTSGCSRRSGTATENSRPSRRGSNISRRLWISIPRTSLPSSVSQTATEVCSNTTAL